MESAVVGGPWVEEEAVDNPQGSDVEMEEDDGNPLEEAQEVNSGDEQANTQTDAAKVVKVKRVITNPRPKLDVQRLIGPRGIHILPSIFKNVKFQGKGHEKDDLDLLLKLLEHWAHRLFPRYMFRDTLQDIEKQGTKKRMQVHLKQLRLDMFQPRNENEEEDTVRRGTDDNGDQLPPEPEIDVFDELLGTTRFPQSSTATHLSQTSTPTTHLPQSTHQPLGLTEEQQARIDYNRQMALERRLARLRQQEEQDNSQPVEDIL